MTPLWRVVPAAVGMVAALALVCRPAHAAVRVLIIEGIGGEPAYTQQFDAQVQAIAAASRNLTAAGDVQLLRGAAASRAGIVHSFRALGAALGSQDRLIVYLVGHGSFDGRQYKFNIAGPDLTGQDLAGLLDALPARRQLIVATGSSSGALLAPLARPERLLITATRSGDEKNATRFGAAFAVALRSAAADTDKNEAISAQEAYDFANRQVQAYFRAQTLLATEHAVLQGDGGAGFPIAALQPTTAALGDAGASAGTGAAAPPALLRERAALNERIQALEQRKGSLPPASYSAQLTQLLLQLAQLQERIDAHDKPATAPAPAR